MTTNRLTGKGKRFATRLYYMRVIGLGIGFFCVASVLRQFHVATWTWALLVIHGFAWPHLAYRFALSWNVPYRGERCNLILDAILGGFWAVSMRFNLLPCVLVLSMISMNSIAAGGLRLFLRGVAAQVAGAILGALVFGVHFVPWSAPSVMIACLPFLLLYPLALGWLTYRLSQRLARQARELERLSQTDGLTGLWNRRHWEDRLAEQFDRCRHGSFPACLVLFDLDHFKRVNDTEGHAAGDAALRSFAMFLRANLRAHDVIGRYGGEEFAVLLPGATLAEAEMLVELLLDNLRKRAGRLGEPLRCTTSAGLAEYGTSMGDIHAWLKEADRCLYAAKANGRDCLVTVPDEPAPMPRIVRVGFG